MRTLVFLLIAGLLCMLTFGCTVIGVGIGAAVDRHHERPRHVTREYAHTIPSGSDVRVTLTSDSILHGKFTGWRSLPTGRAFVVQSEGQTTAVPLEQIREIFAMPRRSNYGVLGGVIGFAADAAVVAALAHQFNKHPMFPDSGP